MMIMIIIMIIIIIIIIIINIMKHNKESAANIRRFKDLFWDIESTHVEINYVFMSVICFCVLC